MQEQPILTKIILTMKEVCAIIIFIKRVWPLTIKHLVAIVTAGAIIRQYLLILLMI